MAIDWSVVPQELVSEEPPWDDMPETQVPAQSDPFNLAPIRNKFSKYSARVDELLAKAKAHEVKDEGSNQEAVAQAGAAKKLFNDIEKQRKQIVENPNAFIKAVNNLAKTFTAPLEGIEKNLKAKSAQYLYAQEQERIKAEKLAREQAAKLQAQVEAEAKAAGVQPPTVAPPVIPQPDRVVRTETGSAHLKKDWTFEIVNEEEIPRSYMLLNEVKVRTAIKAGIRNIPGLRIFEKPNLTIRS